MEKIALSKSQRHIIKRMVIYVIILIVSCVIYSFLSSSEEEHERKNKLLQNEINELTRKLDGLNKKTLELSDAISTWEGLLDSDKELQGLRINDAKDMLDKLQAKYKLAAVKTSFSKPEEIAGDYKTDTVTMVSSVISISFNAISDEHVYNFINDIVNNFPGFIQIKSFSMNKPAAITKDVLKKISIGEEVLVLPVTLDLYWQDLKYKAPTPVDAATPPAPAGGLPPK